MTIRKWAPKNLFAAMKRILHTTIHVLRGTDAEAEDARFSCWPSSGTWCYWFWDWRYFFRPIERCRLVRRGSNPSFLRLRAPKGDSDIRKCQWYWGRENPYASGRWGMPDPRRCGTV